MRVMLVLALALLSGCGISLKGIFVGGGSRGPQCPERLQTDGGPGTNRDCGVHR